MKHDFQYGEKMYVEYHRNVWDLKCETVNLGHEAIYKGKLYVNVC